MYMFVLCSFAQKQEYKNHATSPLLSPKNKTILLLSYCSTKCGKLEMRKCVCTVTACGWVVLGGGKCMFHLPSFAFAAKLNIVCPVWSARSHTTAHPVCRENQSGCRTVPAETVQ